MKLVHLYIWFDDEFAYYLRIPRETADKILSEMELITDHVIDEYVY